MTSTYHVAVPSSYQAPFAPIVTSPEKPSAYIHAQEKIAGDPFALASSPLSQINPSGVYKIEKCLPPDTVPCKTILGSLKNLSHHCDKYIQCSLAIGDEYTARGRPFIRHPPPCVFLPYLHRRDPDKGMYVLEAIKKNSEYLMSALVSIPKGLCQSVAPSRSNIEIWKVEKLDVGQFEDEINNELIPTSSEKETGQQIIEPAVPSPMIVSIQPFIPSSQQYVNVNPKMGPTPISSSRVSSTPRKQSIQVYQALNDQTCQIPQLSQTYKDVPSGKTMVQPIKDVYQVTPIYQLPTPSPEAIAQQTAQQESVATSQAPTTVLSAPKTMVQQQPSTNILASPSKPEPVPIPGSIPIAMSPPSFLVTLPGNPQQPPGMQQTISTSQSQTQLEPTIASHSRNVPQKSFPASRSSSVAPKLPKKYIKVHTGSKK